MKKVAYVVWVGKVPGVYNTWKEVEENTKGFQHSRFKGFHSLAQAEAAKDKPWQDYIQMPTKEKVAVVQEPVPEHVLEQAHEHEPVLADDNYGLAPGETPW